MRWLLLTIGKPKLPCAALGIADYLQRLQRTIRIEWHPLRPSTPERETEALLQASHHTFRIALDEHGTSLPSRDFAQRVDQWQSHHKSIALLVGGADGLPAAVRTTADWLWALGPHTMQHELATLVALEQLYRAHQILANTPYHRDTPLH